MKAPSRLRPKPAPAMCILAPLLVDDDPAVEEAEGLIDPESPVAVGPGASVAGVIVEVVPF